MLESSTGFFFFFGGGGSWQRELFLFDTNFSTMCPQETCGSEWFQGYLGSAQENKGTLTVQEEFGGAITLTLEEHSQAENSGGSDRPRSRRSPTLTAAHPHRPPPGTQGSMLPPDQRRAPSLPPGSSQTSGGRRRRRLAGSPPPYLSGQGVRARLQPHRRPTPKTLPVPPRPARVSCPMRRPTSLVPPQTLLPRDPERFWVQGTHYSSPKTCPS